MNFRITDEQRELQRRARSLAQDFATRAAQHDREASDPVENYAELRDAGFYMDKLKPSEYWRRQCKATLQYNRVGTKLIDDMGVETLMWGSDYPRPDGVRPESAKYIKDQFSHLPADVTRKMTCENVLRPDWLN